MTREQYLQLFGGTGNFRPTASLNISSSAQYSASYFMITSSFHLSSSRISPSYSLDSSNASEYNNYTGSNSISNETLFLQSSSYSGVLTFTEDIVFGLSESLNNRQTLIGDSKTNFKGISITASGEISASGDIIADDLQLGTGRITRVGGSGNIDFSSTPVIGVTTLKVNSSITSSGYNQTGGDFTVRYPDGTNAFIVGVEQPGDVNFGIGTTTPGTNLEVIGSISASSNITGNKLTVANTVIFSNLPTEDPGIAGHLYRDEEGIVKVSL